jgi:hypothetical protein
MDMHSRADVKLMLERYPQSLAITYIHRVSALLGVGWWRERACWDERPLREGSKTLRAMGIRRATRRD